MSRPRQDDKIENKQLRRFGMTPSQGRSNKYVPDGSLLIGNKEYRGELKSTSDSRGHFSTSSRMGIMKVQAWRDGFDFSVFSIVDENDNFVEDYLCFHQDLEPFYEKVINKQNKGHAGRAGMNSWNRAREELSRLGWAEDELMSLHKQNLFGSRINDPGISVADVRQWGIKLNSDDPKGHLQEILKRKINE